MKKYLLRTAIVAAVTTAGLLQSCSDTAETAETSTDVVDVQTAEEAANQAAAEIDETNVDAELDKLSDEIESELDG